MDVEKQTSELIEYIAAVEPGHRFFHTNLMQLLVEYRRAIMDHRQRISALEGARAPAPSAPKPLFAGISLHDLEKDLCERRKCTPAEMRSAAEAFDAAERNGDADAMRTLANSNAYAAHLALDAMREAREAEADVTLGVPAAFVLGKLNKAIGEFTTANRIMRQRVAAVAEQAKRADSSLELAAIVSDTRAIWS